MSTAGHVALHPSPVRQKFGTATSLTKALSKAWTITGFDAITPSP